MRRVVVTGLGLVTPLGGDVETTGVLILTSESITRFNARLILSSYTGLMQPGRHLKMQA